jgi:hypothetical protein
MLQVGNYVDKGAIIHWTSVLLPIFTGLGLKMRTELSGILNMAFIVAEDFQEDMRLLFGLQNR